MDITFIQFLTTQAGLGGLAALALWLNNKQAQDAIRRERENSEATRQMNAELLRALNENTRALVGLEGAQDSIKAAVDALRATIEALAYERGRSANLGR